LGWPAAGFADVVSIDKTDEHFRLLYNTKGRFAVHRIKAQEAEVRPEPPTEHCGSCQASARRRRLLGMWLGCEWLRFAAGSGRQLRAGGQLRLFLGKRFGRRNDERRSSPHLVKGIISAWKT